MLRRIAVLLLLVATACYGQQVTAVTASKVADSMGNPIGQAQLCFAPVDASGKPIGFRAGTVQVTVKPACGLLSNGGLVSAFKVYDSGHTVPANVRYHIYVMSRTSTDVIRDFGITTISGASWSLDSWDQNATSLPALYTPSSTSGDLAVNGALSTTGGLQVAGQSNLHDVAANSVAVGSKQLTDVVTTSVMGPTNTPFGNPAVVTHSLGTVDDGYSVMGRARTQVQSHVIVFYGSSVCSGVGASSYANSWPGMLQAALQAKGYTVYNMSIPGDSTTALIGRFYTDVAPLHPSIVLNCSGLVNDGYDQHQFYVELSELIRMERNIGAIPMVATQYANSNFTTAQYIGARWLMDYFERLGVVSINLWGSTTDPNTGHYLNSALTTDNIHATDTGQLLIYQGISPAVFDYPATENYLPIEGPRGAWKLVGAADANTAPLAVTLDSDAASWTVAAWVKDGGAAGVAAFALHNSAGNLNVRVNNAGGYWTLAETANSTNYTLIASSINAVSGLWHHLAVTYNSYQNSFTLYIDAIPVGSATSNNAAAINTVHTVEYLGNSFIANAQVVGGSITDALFYRVPLMISDIANLYVGNIFRGSLQFGTRFSAVPHFGGSTVVNYATTLGASWSNQAANARWITGTPPAIMTSAGAVDNNDLALLDGSNQFSGVNTFAVAPVIAGITNGSAAAAGKIGEFVSSYVVSGSAVALTNGTGANVTSITLSAGDWDVEGNVLFNGTTATVAAGSLWVIGVNTLSGGIPTDGSASRLTAPTVTSANMSTGGSIARKVYNVTTPTTVYLIAQASFTSGSVSAYGGITARRIR